jgi:ectoine hydroxylase-related dioxygenase (phytanoyl-CoA dioxygenase family)
MSLDNNSYKDQLFKEGYCHVKKFFDQEESDKLKILSKKLHAEYNQNSETNYTLRPLYNYKEYWDLITNKKILDFSRKLLGNNITYLYNSKSVYQSSNGDLNWHRDNVSRNFDQGQDWDKNEKYNVLRIAIYLSSYEKAKTGLKVIPKSHQKKGAICFILRLLRKRFKKIYFNKFFRKIFDKLVGKEILVDKGDCVFFIANLYHAAMETEDIRQAIFLSYGTNNIHAYNYTNYYFKQGENKERFAIDEKMINKTELENLLKKEKLFFPIPLEKETVEKETVEKETVEKETVEKETVEKETVEKVTN